MEEFTPRFDRYEIREELSRGSMGVVYRAFDPILQREVAIKVLAQGRVASREDVARFMREARAVARLAHPNIVPVHEVGEHSGSPYFTMDFIHGKVLSQVLRAEGALAPRRAVHIAREVARALMAAHDKGLIHRDIKPSNVMLADDGRVMVMDFGLAKDMSSDTVRTQSGTTIGTPAYMPPEQARGHTAEMSERSDVYSVGAVLYECLTGRAPFEGEGMVEVVMHVLEDPPVPPRKLNPKIPRDLEIVVLKCLEKSPKDRYATMAALERDLSHYLEGEAIEAHRPGLLRRAGRRIRQHGRTLGGILTGAAAATALIIFLLMYTAPLRPEKSQTLAWSGALTTDGQPDPSLWRVNSGYLDYDPASASFKASLVGKELVTKKEVYGNVLARLRFTAGEGKGSLGIRLNAREGAAFMVLLGEDGILRLIGPTDLENFPAKRPLADVKLLAAGESEALVPGRQYTLEVSRTDLDISAAISPADEPPPVRPIAAIEYRGLQLSNWRLKDVYIGVLGVDERITHGDLKLWVEVPGDRPRLLNAHALFHSGEYNGAWNAYNAIVEDKNAPTEEKASALLHLGYYHEIKYEYDEAARWYDRVVEVCGKIKAFREVCESARMRKFLVLTKKKAWREAAEALETIEDAVASPWRWELLPAAERLLAGGQSEPAAKLLALSTRFCPVNAIAARLSAAAGSLIASGELAYAVLLLADVHYPGRKDAVERLIAKAREMRNRPALIRSAAMLAEEAAGEGREAVIASLAEVVVEAASEDAALAKEIVAHLGNARGEAVTQALWSAVRSGRFREFGILLSLGGSAAPMPGKSLVETAAALSAAGRYEEVVRLYIGTPTDDLLNAALQAAEALAAEQPTLAANSGKSASTARIDLVNALLNSLALRGRMDERVLALAESAAQAQIKRTPSAAVLVAYVRGPFFRPKSLKSLLETALASTAPENRAALLAELWERLLAEDLGDGFDALVEVSAATLDGMAEAKQSPPAEAPWRDARAFDALANRLRKAAGAQAGALLALADIMCLLSHPEKAIVLWDRVAFQNVGATRRHVAQAAFREGLYFLLNGEAGQAAPFMKLAMLSGWKYPGKDGDASARGGAELNRLVEALDGRGSSPPSGDAAAIAGAYSAALAALPAGGLKSLLNYYRPLWEKAVENQPAPPPESGEEKPGETGRAASSRSDEEKPPEAAE
jgi:hypothetical protein